ncbi:MAG: GNAT family N-acetyltransferase [Actinobacteria bacterium]|nr:GNAT family N-acetyltransferase [Actinomycetota bacterium]
MRAHLIDSDQREVAAETLAEAFYNEPLLQVLAPDRRRRMAVGRWFFRVSVDYGMRWGRVWVADGAAAVSIWLPPGSRYSALRSARVGMAAFPFRVGLGPMLDIMRVAPALERLHRSVDGLHWYLMTIGMRPSRQGEGLGSVLVTAGTSQADLAGLPCYLETAAQVDFYAKRGFEVVGRDELNVHTFFGMLRPPASPCT